MRNNIVKDTTGDFPVEEEPAPTVNTPLDEEKPAAKKTAAKKATAKKPATKKTLAKKTK